MATIHGRAPATATDGPTVVVVGNAGVDTNVYLPQPNLDGAGESHFTDNQDVVGQAGGYASCGYARLGQRTAFVGALGQDLAGQLVRQTLAAEGVQLELFDDPRGTARSVNLVFPDGRRRNFYDGKGHMELSLDVTRVEPLLRQVRLVHVNIANWARQLLPLARRCGARVACDIQDVSRPDDPYRADFVAQADVLLFSGVNLGGDPEPMMAAYLRQRPDGVALCGLGAAGCALGTRHGVRRFAALTDPRPVVDTNGAGDALAVGFLTGHLLLGLPLGRAVHMGQLAARHCCSGRGGVAALIRAEDLDAGRA